MKTYNTRRPENITPPPQWEDEEPRFLSAEPSSASTKEET